MSANGISTLASKEDRQVAKLDAAQTKRQASGDVSATAYRTLNSYNIDLLPTKFSGNNLVDNANTEGLVAGRPWVNAPTILTSNIMLNLDPGDSMSYSGSGSQWVDLGPGSVDIMTLYGNPTFTSGTPSYFTFNGTNQYSLGDSIGIVNQNTYTKSAWFYLNGYQDNNIVSGDGHFIYMGPQANIDRKIYCGHSDWASYTAYPSTATINLNTWYNVTLTFSTTNGMTLYINGVQDSTYTARKTAHPGSGSVSIAAYIAGNFLKGRVGKVLCYNAELTAAQVLQNYNATKSVYGL